MNVFIFRNFWLKISKIQLWQVTECKLVLAFGVSLISPMILLLSNNNWVWKLYELPSQISKKYQKCSFVIWCFEEQWCFIKFPSNRRLFEAWKNVFSQDFVENQQVSKCFFEWSPFICDRSKTFLDVIITQMMFLSIELL